MDISDKGVQPTAQVQLALPGWQPGGDLMPLEETMLAQAAAGEPVNRPGPFELAEMQAWGKERTVRAAVLRHLLTAGQWPVASKGVWLRGVRLNGLLNLKAETLRCPLSLDRCSSTPMNLSLWTMPPLRASSSPGVSWQA